MKIPYSVLEATALELYKFDSYGIVEDWPTEEDLKRERFIAYQASTPAEFKKDYLDEAKPIAEAAIKAYLKKRKEKKRRKLHDWKQAAREATERQFRVY